MASYSLIGDSGTVNTIMNSVSSTKFPLTVGSSSSGADAADPTLYPLQVAIIFFSTSDRAYFDASSYVNQQNTAAFEFRNTMLVELWVWPLEDTTPASNQMVLKIVAPQVSEEITVFYSSACKCIRAESLRYSSKAIVSNAVTNLAIPAFLAISVLENFGD